MMNSDRNPLTEFGQNRVKDIGSERADQGESAPSTLRYYTAMALKLSGEFAVLYSALSVVLAVASLFMASDMTVLDHALHIGGSFVYALIAQNAARYLGYEDWWGIGGAK